MFKNVYIIDDDEVSVFLTEAMLMTENFAHNYETFLNPQDALQHLLQALGQGKEDKTPDIIFLDLNMPFMSGWDFLNALAPYEAQLQECCSLYLLSSSMDVQEVQRARKYPLLSGFLQKPLEEATIRDLLKQTS
ncbi:response regulator [Pontibacter korlensis]|uniref:response regulator n=1 Tax=Pontibacter korlensis TaxID=400092 RepID=UPI00061B2490|nr:response regulator [Pontibacter korlensis]